MATDTKPQQHHGNRCQTTAARQFNGLYRGLARVVGVGVVVVVLVVVVVVVVACSCGVVRARWERSTRNSEDIRHCHW
jgi:ABC-type multidrug transport system permease subunit